VTVAVSVHAASATTRRFMTPPRLDVLVRVVAVVTLLRYARVGPR
jgi:hypothetical protein